MPRLAYTRPHKLSLLHDQLLAAGVIPLLVEGSGSAVWITVADEVAESAVDAVVNAHDPAALSVAEQADQERQTARSDLVAQYAAGMTRLDDIVSNGQTLTAVQVRDAVVDLARITRRLLRLLRSA